jgi:hypothetical protein
MTPYPPTATDDYLGLVQLPTGMTALSDWLNQNVKSTGTPTFAILSIVSDGSTVPVTITGASGQIGNYLLIKSFGGTTLFSLDFAGNLVLNGGLTATLASCTGLPISTGVSGLASGIATFLATPSSANLLAALTTKTGTGLAVFADSPTFGASIGIGGAASSTSSLFTQGNALTGTTQYAFRTQTTANEAATTAFYGQATQVRTKATSFTCALGCGVKVLDGSVGAASTLTTHIGIDIDPLTVGGTNNYGIRSTVAGSATGGFNLYLSGTAPNYHKGQLCPGVTSTATAAGTTTLDRSSTPIQVFTGSTTQGVTLPAANLYGSNIGVSFIIKNRSSGTVTVNRAGSDTIDGATSFTLTGGANAAVHLISNGSSEWLVV